MEPRTSAEVRPGVARDPGAARRPRRRGLRPDPADGHADADGTCAGARPGRPERDPARDDRAAAPRPVALARPRTRWAPGDLGAPDAARARRRVPHGRPADTSGPLPPARALRGRPRHAPGVRGRL